MNENSTFQMSIIEIFLVILFIAIGFAYNEMAKKGEQVDSQGEKLEAYEDSFRTSDKLLVQYRNKIDLLSDSIERAKSRMASLENMLTKEKTNKEESKEGEGSGIGACWKRKDGSTVSMFEITFFDRGFSIEPSWPADYTSRVKSLLSPKLIKEFETKGVMNITSSKFLKKFRHIREKGRSVTPPCYYIAGIVDSTSTKEKFFRQEHLANQIFVLNRKNLYQ